MNQLGLAVVAVLCNVGAQVAIKLVGLKVETRTGLDAWLNAELLLAVGLYGLAFLLTVKVFAVNPITIAGPIMAGSTFVLVGCAGVLIFSEALTLLRLLGMACILTGILLMTRA